MKNLTAFLRSQSDVGLLIGRLLGGYIVFWAGVGKLTGPGFGGIGAQFERMGMLVPQLTGPFILLLELLGGAAMILGLFTRILGVLFTIQFLVAFFFVKIGAGYGAFRIDVALIAFGVLWATQGAGGYSLDKALKLDA